MQSRFINGVKHKKIGIVLQYEKKEIDDYRKCLTSSDKDLTDQQIFDIFILSDFKRFKGSSIYTGFLQNVEYIN